MDIQLDTKRDTIDKFIEGLKANPDTRHEALYEALFTQIRNYIESEDQ